MPGRLAGHHRESGVFQKTLVNGDEPKNLTFLGGGSEDKVNNDDGIYVDENLIHNIEALEGGGDENHQGGVEFFTEKNVVSSAGFIPSLPTIPEISPKKDDDVRWFVSTKHDVVSEKVQGLDGWEREELKKSANNMLSKQRQRENKRARNENKDFGGDKGEEKVGVESDVMMEKIQEVKPPAFGPPPAAQAVKRKRKQSRWDLPSAGVGEKNSEADSVSKPVLPTTPVPIFRMASEIEGPALVLGEAERNIRRSEVTAALIHV